MDFECMKSIVQERHTVRVFDKKNIEPGLLEEILGYTLRTPTSMNTQPYKLIVVRDQEKKELLSEYMEVGNNTSVKTSSATVIVCSDQDPAKSVTDFGKFIFSDDQSPKIRKLIRYAYLTYYSNTLLNFMFGWILDGLFCIYRLFATSPSRITNQAWSFQQAAFLIQNLVIIAQSKGIGSVIMEGFSEAGIRSVFNIPKRYQIAAIVSLGYEPKGIVTNPSARFPLERIAYDGYWKQPI